IAGIKIASLQNRDTHRLKVARRERIHERLHVFAVFGLVALNGCRTVPLVSMKQGHHRISGGSNTGNRSDAFPQIAIKIGGSWFIVSIQGRRQLEADEIVHFLKTSIRGPQILQAADEKAGAKKQEEAQGDLRRDQALAKEQRTPARTRNRSNGVLHGGPKIGLRRAPCWNE